MLSAPVSPIDWTAFSANSGLGPMEEYGLYSSDVTNGSQAGASIKLRGSKSDDSLANDADSTLENVVAYEIDRTATRPYRPVRSYQIPVTSSVNSSGRNEQYQPYHPDLQVRAPIRDPDIRSKFVQGDELHLGERSASEPLFTASMTAPITPCDEVQISPTTAGTTSISFFPHQADLGSEIVSPITASPGVSHIQEGTMRNHQNFGRPRAGQDLPDHLKRLRDLEYYSPSRLDATDATERSFNLSQASGSVETTGTSLGRGRNRTHWNNKIGKLANIMNRGVGGRKSRNRAADDHSSVELDAATSSKHTVLSRLYRSFLGTERSISTTDEFELPYNRDRDGRYVPKRFANSSLSSAGPQNLSTTVSVHNPDEFNARRATTDRYPEISPRAFHRSGYPEDIRAEIVPPEEVVKGEKSRWYRRRPRDAERQPIEVKQAGRGWFSKKRTKAEEYSGWSAVYPENR